MRRNTQLLQLHQHGLMSGLLNQHVKYYWMAEWRAFLQ